MTKATKVSLLSFFTVLLIVVLCLVVGSTPPLQASAAGKTQYISEIKFADEGSFDASSKWLSNYGYAVDKEMQGSNTNGAMGYKYTYNPDEALRDIKVMNMKGGYSFAEYDTFANDQEEAAKQLVDILSTGIGFFRKGVKEQWPSSMFARSMLNNFSEDDSKRRLGDFLADLNTSNESLSTVFLQANGAVMSVIKKAIAISSLPEGEKNWMEVAAEISAQSNGNLGAYKTGNYPNKYGDSAFYIWESMKVIQKDLQYFEEFYKGFVKEYGNGLDKNGNKIEISEAKAKEMEEYVEAAFTGKMFAYTELSAIYSTLTSYGYVDDSLTDSDGNKINIKNLADMVINSQKLKHTDFLPIASCFGDENRSLVMYATSIVPFILNVENTKEYWAKAVEETKKVGMLKEVGVTSVYEGVDRSMFVKGGIAMTSEAIRLNNITPDDNPLIGNVSLAAEVALWTVMATAGTVAIGAVLASGSGFGANFVIEGSTAWNINIFENLAARAGATPSTVAEFGSVASETSAFTKSMYTDGLVYKFSNDGKVFMAAVVVVLIVSIVFLSLEIAGYYSKEMTRMPVAIMDNQYKEDKNKYIKYDALTMQTKNESDGYTPYDYNNKAGNQWQILYATKDKSAGAPITNIEFNSSSVHNDSVKPVALFGDSVACDLNKYSSTASKYMFFKQDTKGYPATSSVFMTGTFILTLCGGILGGLALGILGTWLILRKKKQHVSATTPNSLK